LRSNFNIQHKVSARLLQLRDAYPDLAAQLQQQNQNQGLKIDTQVSLLPEDDTAGLETVKRTMTHLHAVLNILQV
jgi:hypothetical protein